MNFATDSQNTMNLLPDDALLSILEFKERHRLPSLRLVCKRFRDLIDAALAPTLTILGSGHAAYPAGSQETFKAAAATMLCRRAACLTSLQLDFDAYGCVFATQLLEQQPLPQLRSVALLNCEAQHAAALRTLPRLQDVTLCRRTAVGAPASAGPAAELLVAQLAGLPLQRLCLEGCRALPGILGSIADALPSLCHLSLSVHKLEQSSRLELAALPRLTRLAGWELRLRGGRAATPDVAVSPLPPGATALGCLTHVSLAHVRPGRGQEDAFWSSLALLPAVASLAYEESGHATRQPPPQLLQLSTLTSLTVRIDGEIFVEDPPASTWTQLPDLPEGALPALTSLHLDCVGLLALPPSWCRLPLRSLSVSGLASERSFYTLRLPEEFSQLAGSLARLELTRCGLGVLPDQVAQLTGLTALGLQSNEIVRLPLLSQLQSLEEVELFGSPATNAASALQGCTALRRLGLGSPHYARGRHTTADGSPDAAYEDAEAASWQEAYLQTVRAALPWVTEIGAS